MFTTFVAVLEPELKNPGYRHYNGKGIAHSAESYGAVDGPGLRYALFLQGCLMRCLYCHNRDTWDSCTGQVQELDVATVMKQVMTYRHYLRATGRSVMATGDEPLLQYEFVRGWFTTCRERDIHTCFNNNSYVLHYDLILNDLLDHTNLVIFDLRQIDPETHRVLVGIPNTKTLKFAHYLTERNQPTRVRYVVVPGYTDDKRPTHLLDEFVGDMGNAEVAESSPYHGLDAHKWALCGDEYKLTGAYPPPGETILKIKEISESCGENVIY